MKLNQDAFEHAKSLILAGKVVRDSEWGESQPEPEDENTFLDNNDWETYGKWYLGLDMEENEQTKGRHKFPFGDFESVHRSGLKAAKQRAGQYEYGDIEDAIDALLIQIDYEPDVVDEASIESFPASDPPNWRERRTDEPTG